MSKESMVETLKNGEKDPEKKFYSKLKRLCADKGVPISIMVSDIGLTSGIITWWKNGSIPRNKTLKKIADYFGVTPQDILSDDNSQEVMGSKPTSPKEKIGKKTFWEDGMEKYERKIKLRQEEPDKVTKLILQNLLSVIDKCGTFSPEAKIAVDAAIDSSIGAILAVLEEKNLHIEALEDGLGMAETSLIEKEEIISGLIAGRPLDDILKELGYTFPEKKD